MGLDQYAYKLKKGIISSAIPNQDIPSKELVEISYWRKHPNLQGWMEKLYSDKGGDEMFNCVYVQLTENDLARLQEDILKNSFEDSVGPFWGDNSDEYYKSEDLEFIRKALKSIEQGYDILYYSWW